MPVHEKLSLGTERTLALVGVQLAAGHSDGGELGVRYSAMVAPSVAAETTPKVLD